MLFPSLPICLYWHILHVLFMLEQINWFTHLCPGAYTQLWQLYLLFCLHCVNTKNINNLLLGKILVIFRIYSTYIDSACSWYQKTELTTCPLRVNELTIVNIQGRNILIFFNPWILHINKTSSSSIPLSYPLYFQLILSSNINQMNVKLTRTFNLWALYIFTITPVNPLSPCLTAPLSLFPTALRQNVVSPTLKKKKVIYSSSCSYSLVSLVLSLGYRKRNFLCPFSVSVLEFSFECPLRRFPFLLLS